MKARLAGAHAVSHMTAVSAASRPASAGVTMPLAAPKTSHGSVNAIVVASNWMAATVARAAIVVLRSTGRQSVPPPRAAASRTRVVETRSAAVGPCSTVV